jgi:meso-butanediol dehydrogenase / (S,S)-butanediol dehydrogenase / diacetyl reductase
MTTSSLHERRALVTGAGTGIGRAIAIALAREGARVCVTDLDGKCAQQTADGIGAKAFSAALDVTDEAATAEIFADAHARLGGLDLICANAGVSSMGRVTDLSIADWDHNMNVNAKGIFLTNREAVRWFLRDNVKGTIVNTASLAAKVGAPLLAHYSASKFAVVGFTQALAREVASHGIRVNAVCPGFVRTSMQEREITWEAQLRGLTKKRVVDEYVQQTPLGRLEEPEDVADVVVFLSSSFARFMTGQAVNVTGGVYMT